MCLSGLLKIGRRVFEIYRQKDFRDIHVTRLPVTLTFDLLTPKVDRFIHYFCQFASKSFHPFSKCRDVW